MLFALVLVT